MNEMTIAGVTLHFYDEDCKIQIEYNAPYQFEDSMTVHYLVDVVQELADDGAEADDITLEEGFVVVADTNELYDRAYEFGKRDARIAYEFIQEFFATKDELEDDAE